VTDRSSAYHWYPVRWRQLGWAPVRRDGAALRGRGGAAEALGDALLAQAHQRLTWWHRGRAGPRQRASVRSSRSPLRREVERGLAAGSRCGVPQTAGTVEGVEPTPNAAERSIRPGVLWRKGSFGTQSEEGSRFVASMMTVGTTLTPQPRHVLAYLTAAWEAALRGEAAPSLLPASDQKSQAAE
jgi:transposase